MNCKLPFSEIIKMGDEQPVTTPDIKLETQESVTDSANEQDAHSEQSLNVGTVETQKTKIDILLKATGNAPIMKKKKWAVDPERKIGCLIDFIKKYLKLEPSDSLFLYVNQAFAPSPDQTVKNVFDCFGTDGKLILHYCKSQAWG
ncbi:autophagy-related 12 isoform X1 [Lycorma delicatula]|uniref:autophagy-related 12 isoform X1 n=2 Tax=Lycorma delicatula TaxID=130591 RepID=UPI003F50DF1A